MELIDKILREWAYRVHDGMPNLKNPLHLVQLKETLNELRLPRKVTEKLLNNLRAVEEEYNAIKKDTGNTSTFDSEEARDAAIKRGTHTKVKDKEDDVKPGSMMNETLPAYPKELKNIEKAEKIYAKAVAALGKAVEKQNKKSGKLIPNLYKTLEASMKKFKQMVEDEILSKLQ